MYPIIENAYEFAKDIEIEVVVVFCGIDMEKSLFDLKYPILYHTVFG